MMEIVDTEDRFEDVIGSRVSMPDDEPTQPEYPDLLHVSLGLQLVVAIPKEAR
jgi:hypothetical protein